MNNHLHLNKHLARQHVFKYADELSTCRSIRQAVFFVVFFFFFQLIDWPSKKTILIHVFGPWHRVTVTGAGTSADGKHWRAVTRIHVRL